MNISFSKEELRLFFLFLNVVKNMFAIITPSLMKGDEYMKQKILAALVIAVSALLMWVGLLCIFISQII